MALNHQISDIREAFIAQITQVAFYDILVGVIGAATNVFLGVCFYALVGPCG